MPDSSISRRLGLPSRRSFLKGGQREFAAAHCIELLSRLKAGRRRRKLTATSTIQCGSNRVSAKSLPKTGISGNLAGDLRQFLSKVVAIRSLETARRPYFAGFPRL